MTGIFSPETLTTWKIWIFGITRIPLIFFCRPRVVTITETSLEVIIKLNRRTRNHLNSMYFGVLSVGADVTGGFLAMEYIRASKSKISLIERQIRKKSRYQTSRASKQLRSCYRLCTLKLPTGGVDT